MQGGDQLQTNLAAPNINFNAHLDFLRSFAVILVVFDHLMLALGRDHVHGYNVGMFGVSGVFMFFVHTALVLLWSLERKPYALDFYIRRVFRIYPLAIAGTLAIVFTHAPLTIGIIPYFQSFPVTLHNLLANLLLIFNLGQVDNGYRALLHVEWTLPWELQMYILLPVIFAFVQRETVLWPLFLFWLLAARLDYVNHLSPLSFPGSIPNFLGGVVSFVAFKSFRKVFPPWAFPLYLIAITWLLVKLNNTNYSWTFTLLLGLSLPLFAQASASWFSGACKQIAQYSYGIYIVHPFGIWIGLGLLHSLGRTLGIAIALICTAVLCFAAYHLLEKPLINVGRIVAARVEVMALARGKEHLL